MVITVTAVLSQTLRAVWWFKLWCFGCSYSGESCMQVNWKIWLYSHAGIST